MPDEVDQRIGRLVGEQDQLAAKVESLEEKLKAWESKNKSKEVGAGQLTWAKVAEEHSGAGWLRMSRSSPVVLIHGAADYSYSKTHPLRDVGDPAELRTLIEHRGRGTSEVAPSWPLATISYDQILAALPWGTGHTEPTARPPEASGGDAVAEQVARMLTLTGGRGRGAAKGASLPAPIAQKLPAEASSSSTIAPDDDKRRPEEGGLVPSIVFGGLLGLAGVAVVVLMLSVAAREALPALVAGFVAIVAVVSALAVIATDKSSL